MPPQVAALLSESSSAWRRGLQRMVGPWAARRLGLAEDWAAPASLSFVYDDDLAHLPIHYIALGAPVSMCVPSPLHPFACIHLHGRE